MMRKEWANIIRIEPDWNVNAFIGMLMHTDERIRIEPDWNVNVRVETTIAKAVGIRIEPDWNVNYDIVIISEPLGFDQNRTRLECKAS